MRMLCKEREGRREKGEGERWKEYENSEQKLFMQLIETIKAVDGKLFYLEYHQQRFDKSLKILGSSFSARLDDLLEPPQKGVVRCRILYDDTGILDIGYRPYTSRTFNTLQAVIDNSIDYKLKSADRSTLNALYQQRGLSDDIAIIKNGLLTDTSIANIALFDGGNWVTPAAPLLKGTTRQRLLQNGKLQEKEIHYNEIHLYKKVAVMNAMLGFLEVKNGIIAPKS